LATVLAAVCICLLARAYPLAAVAAVISFVLIFRWSWITAAHPAMAPASSPGEPPAFTGTWSGFGVWGGVITLIADGSLYLSLLFGWFYLWTVAPQWSAPAVTSVSVVALLISGVLLTAAVGLYHWLRTQLRRNIGSGLTNRL